MSALIRLGQARRSTDRDEIIPWPTGRDENEKKDILANITTLEQGLMRPCREANSDSRCVLVNAALDDMLMLADVAHQRQQIERSHD